MEKEIATLKNELNQLAAAILVLAFHSDQKCTNITTIMDEFYKILKHLEEFEKSGASS